MCNLRLNIIDIPHVEEQHFKFKSEDLNWIIVKLEMVITSTESCRSCGFFSLSIHVFIFFCVYT